MERYRRTWLPHYLLFTKIVAYENTRIVWPYWKRFQNFHVSIRQKNLCFLGDLDSPSTAILMEIFMITWNIWNWGEGNGNIFQMQEIQLLSCEPSSDSIPGYMNTKWSVNRRATVDQYIGTFSNIKICTYCKRCFPGVHPRQQWSALERPIADDLPVSVVTCLFGLFAHGSGCQGDDQQNKWHIRLSATTWTLCNIDCTHSNITTDRFLYFCRA